MCWLSYEPDSRPGLDQEKERSGQGYLALECNKEIPPLIW